MIVRREALSLLALVIALLVALTVALTVPGAGFSSAELFTTLLGGDGGESLATTVLYEWRMPRVLAAMLVGASLALAGGLFQSVTRNPLGSPDILGFNAGAYTGVIVITLMGFHSFVNTAIGALVGGAVATALIMGVSLKTSAMGQRIIIVGLGISLTLSAFNRWLLLRADTDTALITATWAAGSLNGMQWRFVLPAALAMTAPILLALLTRPWCDNLQLGDETAQATGVHLRRTVFTLSALSAVLTALACALAGPISFVALASPHIAGFLTGGRRTPLATTALVGVTLVLIADVIGQRLFPPTQLPVGIITVVTGGAYLLAMMFAFSRQRKVA